MLRSPSTHRASVSSRLVGVALVIAPCLALASACSSNSSPAAAVDAGPGGGPVVGPVDMHCAGMTPQVVNESSCHVTDAGPPPDAGPVDASTDGDVDTGPVSDFGATMYNSSGDDDDCKYHVVWSITPTHVNQPATITVTVTNLTDGTPVTGYTPHVEYFDSTQDTETDTATATSTPGQFTIEPISFNTVETWQIRFHIHEECADVLDDSPHGHAAFYLTVNP